MQTEELFCIFFTIFEHRVSVTRLKITHPVVATTDRLKGRFVLCVALLLLAGVAGEGGAFF